MSIKSFLLKNTLRMKGVSKDQAEALAQKLEENPELMDAMKAIEANPELKVLMEKIQKEIEEKMNGGMDQIMASTGVMMKYKNELAKYRDLLIPLMTLMQK